MLASEAGVTEVVEKELSGITLSCSATIVSIFGTIVTLSSSGSFHNSVGVGMVDLPYACLHV